MFGVGKLPTLARRRRGFVINLLKCCLWAPFSVTGLLCSHPADSLKPASGSDDLAATMDRNMKICFSDFIFHVPAAGF